jgi:hypothetical protein
MQRIAVVQGAPGSVIQELFAEFVGRWRVDTRIADVLVESHGLADRACSAGYLDSIANGERFTMFNDLGKDSTGCHLEAAGVLAAAGRVKEDMAAGCDLVVLSKFGKLEAGGGGLRDAFAATLAAMAPLLTSVSPALETEFQALANSSYSVLPANAETITDWWNAVRQRR